MHDLLEQQLEHLESGIEQCLCQLDQKIFAALMFPLASSFQIEGANQELKSLREEVARLRARLSVWEKSDVLHVTKHDAAQSPNMQENPASRPQPNEKSWNQSEEHVLRGLQRRSEMFLLGVFNDFKDADTGSIARERMKSALKACHVESVDAEQMDELLSSMDSDSNDLFSFEEFKRVVAEPTEIEHLLLSLAPHLILADAVPRKEGVDAISSFRMMTPEDVDTMLDASREQLKLSILECCSRMNHVHSEHQKHAHGNSKFSCFTMNTGVVDDFHHGLGNRVGPPHLHFLTAMEMEHLAGAWARHFFTTSNYDITTCPEDEWNIVMRCDSKLANMAHGRQLKPIEEIEQSTIVQQAKLIRCEIISVVLYTGPMFAIYNGVLRRFPVDIYEKFSSWGNLYTTTIHVLVSAIQKIMRVMKLPDGLKLYRGLGGTMDLPDHFFKADAQGCKGFAEWAFMSTTSQREVALNYSGIREGRPKAAVLSLTVGAVDRGACIRDLSQYPTEVEYLFLPLSFVAPAGPPVYEVTGDGLVKLIPVRINANLKSQTVEQMLERKKQNHLTSFRYLVDELRVELLARANTPEAQARWEVDRVKKAGDRTGKPSTQVLAEAAVAGFEKVLAEQQAQEAEYFVDSFNFRSACEGMLDGLLFARSKWAYWMANRSEKIEVVKNYRPRTCHRLYCAMLENQLLRLPADDPDRRKQALELCRLKGLLCVSVDERNDGNETPVQEAAADGRGEGDLRLLVAAGSDIHRSDGLTGALFLAAQYGRTDSVRGLVALGARMEEGRKKDNAPPLWIAALNGHVEPVLALCDLRADVNQAADNKCTPIYVAAEFDQGDCVRALAARGADVNCMERNGMTPAFIAALNGHVNAVRALHEVKADLNLAKPSNGCTPAYVAAEFGHLACLRALAECGADMHRANVNGVTPRDKATTNGQKLCAEFLAGLEPVAAEGEAAAVPPPPS